jgi:hypothetical protein
MIRDFKTNKWIFTYGDAIEAISPPAKGNEYYYVSKKNDEGIPQHESYENIVWLDINSDPKPSEADVKAKFIELQAAEPMRLLRVERNRKLAETDWMANKDVTLPAAWKTYRQALRDLPTIAEPKLDENGQLTNVIWPIKPE